MLESSLAPGRRIEIHHAAVAALERLDAPAAMIAVHAFAAAEIDRRDAIRWTSAAGVDASAIGAHAEAANWFEQAASVASTSPRPRRWLRTANAPDTNGVACDVPLMRAKPTTMFLAWASWISKKSPSSTTFAISSFTS